MTSPGKETRSLWVFYKWMYISLPLSCLHNCQHTQRQRKRLTNICDGSTLNYQVVPRVFPTKMQREGIYLQKNHGTPICLMCELRIHLNQLSTKFKNKDMTHRLCHRLSVGGEDERKICIMAFNLFTHPMSHRVGCWYVISFMLMQRCFQLHIISSQIRFHISENKNTFRKVWRIRKMIATAQGDLEIYTLHDSCTHKWV